LPYTVKPHPIESCVLGIEGILFEGIEIMSYIYENDFMKNDSSNTVG
jgi:hypothetical protein